MECFWRLFRHRQPDGYCHQQDPPVFHVYLHPHHGLADHYLYDPGILEEYAALYLGCQKKSLVLSMIIRLKIY